MNGVLIMSEVKEYNRYSPEFLELEKQNEGYKKQIDDLQKDMDYIKKHIPGITL